MALEQNDPDIVFIRPCPLGCEVTILPRKPFQLRLLLRLGKMQNHLVPPELEGSVGVYPKRRCADIGDHEPHGNRLQ